MVFISLPAIMFHQCRDDTFLQMIDFTNQETYYNDNTEFSYLHIKGGWINEK